MKELFLTWLNRFLVFDVFLVIFGFFWFAIAVVGESTGLPLGYHLWQQLWLPLFNPAISILILGALLSWLMNKLGQWFSSATDK